MLFVAFKWCDIGHWLSAQDKNIQLTEALTQTKTPLVVFILLLKPVDFFSDYLTNFYFSLLDTATSSQGMQDHIGAKSGNWLASWLNCQPRFQFFQTWLGKTMERG